MLLLTQKPPPKSIKKNFRTELKSYLGVCTGSACSSSLWPLGSHKKVHPVTFGSQKEVYPFTFGILKKVHLVTFGIQKKVHFATWNSTKGTSGHFEAKNRYIVDMFEYTKGFQMEKGFTQSGAVRGQLPAIRSSIKLRFFSRATPGPYEL